MRITLKNYEAFFLDYHEGSLNLQQVAELMIFLEGHPALKEEFEAFQNFSLKAEVLAFPEKSLLKKTAGLHDDLLIGHLEGALSQNEEKKVQNLLISQPELSLELAQFKQTILVPDPDIIFENKASLKRKDKKGWVINLYYYVSAAASVALIIGVYLFFIYQARDLKFTQIEKRQAPLANFKNNMTSIVHAEKTTNVKAFAKAIKTKKHHDPETKGELISKLAIPTDSLYANPIANNTPVENKIDSAAIEISTFQTISAADFRKNEIVKEKRSPLWNLAVLCSRGINRLTGKHLELKKEIEPDSSRIEYVVSAGSFGFSRSVSK